MGINVSEIRPSKQAGEALRVATEALELGHKQAVQIDSAKKMGYEANNKIDSHEEICALRAQQTLDKVGDLDKKIDKLISVFIGSLKVVGTAGATIIAGIIVWLVQSTNGVG